MKGVGQESSLSYLCRVVPANHTMGEPRVQLDTGWRSPGGHARRALGMMQQCVGRKTLAHHVSKSCFSTVEHRKFHAHREAFLPMGSPCEPTYTPWQPLPPTNSFIAHDVYGILCHTPCRRTFEQLFL